MLSSRRVADDERKGRRLGDDTKGRIADLASGWTVDDDAPPVPEPPVKREASGAAAGHTSGPTRAPDAPRRTARTQPPPAPGSAARKALEDKLVELREAYGEPDLDPVPRPPVAPARPAAAPARARAPSTSVPTVPAPAGKRPRTGAVELGALPEADKTKENRGAVGVKHDKSASITTNSASGTIGGDTPSPIFDRAAIAAGQHGALASERLDDRPRPTTPSRFGASGSGGAVFADQRGEGGDREDEDEDDGEVDLRELIADVSGAIKAATSDDAPRSRLGSPAGDAIPPRAGDRPSGAAGTPRAFVDRPSQPSGPAGSSGSGPAARGTPRTFLERSLSPDAAPSAAAPRSAVDRQSPPAPRPVSDDGFSEETGELILPPLGDPRRAAAERADDKARREAASALLGLPVAKPARMPSEVLFDDPTRRNDRASFQDASAASTGRFDRGDPTFDPAAPDGDGGEPRDDATALSAPAAGTATAAVSSTGTLRSSASLPRRRGIAGDLRYLATVFFGLRRARRETAVLTQRHTTRQQSRRHHLVTLGRAAANTDGFHHAALDAAREHLATVEDERDQHAGHVAAADAELARVRRDREAKAKQCAADLAALDTEIAGLTKKLEPLLKDIARIKRRGVDLHEALRQIDARIATTEAVLRAPRTEKTEKLDRAEVQAEIATLKADRKSIQADEPGIASQIDALSPQIAALEASRTEAEHKRAELASAEQDDQRRVEELLAAIGAKRKVVDRAVSDAEARRDKILFKLGERLYVDRPDDLAPELAPVDAIDLELGSDDRRMMELREILASVDRWKLARGIALLVLIVGGLGALALWLLVLNPVF